MGLEEIYNKIEKSHPDSSKYVESLYLRHWFTELLTYDPVTGEPLPIDSDSLLQKILEQDLSKDLDNKHPHDMLWKLLDYTGDAIQSIFEMLSSKYVRNHELMPLHRYREADAKTTRWLGKRPGRNIKQKLSGRTTIMGIRHLKSIDTLENRLFKVFLQQLNTLLEAKERAFGVDRESDLFIRIHRWLRSDIAEAIGIWSHNPPNNTLLNHKAYRKIWIGWTKLQKIDDDTEKDIKYHKEQKKILYHWTAWAFARSSKKVMILQQPIFPNYNSDKSGFDFEGFHKTDHKLLQGYTILGKESKVNSFKILGDNDDIVNDDFKTLREKSYKLCQKNTGCVPQISTTLNRKKNIYAVLDLNSIKPKYTLQKPEKTANGRLNSKLLYQFWTKKNQSNKLDINGANSDLLQLNELKDYSIETVTIKDLLEVSNSRNKLTIDRTGRLFAGTIKNELKVTDCTYLIPDGKSDFSLERLCRIMNSSFQTAETLPRSIAKIFSWQSSKDFPNYNGKKLKKGDTVVVVDQNSNGTTLIHLQAVYSDKLKKRLPESKGYSWLRIPPEVIESGSNFKKSEFSKLFTPEDIKNNYKLLPNFICKNREQPVSIPHFDKKLYNQYREPKNNNRIYLNITDSDNLTKGALILRDWQAKVPETALWKDQLPSLSMKIEDQSGKETLFHLVRKNDQKITPRRGVPVNIPINDVFELPKGKEFYEFPLDQSQGKQREKYFAYLKHPSFPLTTSIRCKLKLTYTYGEAVPYNLVFCPKSEEENTFEEITVEWTNKSNKDWRNLPYPEFIKEHTFNDLKSIPNKDKSKKPSDIPDWLERELIKVNDLAIDGNWYTINKAVKDKKGNWFYILNYRDYNGRDAKCFQRNIPIPENKHPLEIGSKVFCVLYESDAPQYGPEASSVALLNDNKCFLAKSLRFPALTFWNQGRSLQNPEIPNSLRQIVSEVTENIEKNLSDRDNKIPEKLEAELLLLLSYMHKDMPRRFHEVLDTPRVDLKRFYEHMGYAIGDGKLDWQNNILKNAIKNLNDRDNKQFAIQTLSKALWREKNLVLNISIEDITTIIDCSIAEIKLYAKSSNLQWHQSKCLSSYLEVLLAVLRHRGGDSDKFKELLSPHYNNKLKGLIKNLNNIEKKYKKNWNPKNIHSYLDFDLKKPKGCKTPDILFVLQKYIRGSDDSTSIRVIGTNDN